MDASSKPARPSPRPLRFVGTRGIGLALAVALVASSVPPAAAASPIAVVDDAGRTVHLAAPAHRVVSLAPHLTELLYDVDAGDALVGATDYSDHPDAARRLPRVGGASGIDVERLVALHPDLVVAWRSGTPEATLHAIEAFGIPVYRSEPLALDDVATSLERLGALTGHRDVADARAAAYRARVASIARRHAHDAPVRVFYQVWNRPLMTVGGSHLISRVIALCGGRNVFEALAPLAPTVDPEAVIAADPQLIVAAADPATAAATEASDVAGWDRWTGVDAVRRHAYLFVDPALITRHTPRILDGADRLCGAIDRVRHAP